MRITSRICLLTLWAGIATAQIGSIDAPVGQQRGVLLPLQNRTGNTAIGDFLVLQLRNELQSGVTLIESGQVRDSLRRLRIRDTDATAPDRLRRAFESFDVERLISVTLHDLQSRGTPRITLSARVYDAASGELLTAVYRAASGRDRETVLGLRTESGAEELVRRVTRQFGRDLQLSRAHRDAQDPITPESRERGDPWVLLPFAGLTARNASQAAETATEATRALVLEQGVRLVSPNRVLELLRQQRVARWDHIDDQARLALREEFGAAFLLTGSIDIYDAGGGGRPDPEVSVGLRFIDARTGLLLWSESLERRGRQTQGLFGIGRIHSQGALAQQLLEKLTRQLLKAQPWRGRTIGGIG